MIKSILKIIKNICLPILSSPYSKYLEKPINDRIIFLESQLGIQMQGNIFYILKELTANREYEGYRLYLSVAHRNYFKFKRFMKAQNLKGINLVIARTGKFYRLLATSKYLINDNVFVSSFIKRQEQVYLNTWHGTPLKTLGRSNKSEYHAIGNMQKNFFVADYLLYPNEFTYKRMFKDYMLQNICNAKILFSGYPRNSVFFENENTKRIRLENGLNAKKVYMYMPTWRGMIGNINGKNGRNISEYLFELDGKLSDDEIMYVNLHPIDNKTIDFKQYTHIKEFLQNYETYEFLSAADVLITDYSSVMFDFGLTRKKIVLFTYDAKQYRSDRGLYITLDKLPFPKVDNIDDLLTELRTPKHYDDTGFHKKFCSYDSIDATKLLCERVILGKKNQITEFDAPKNDADNILIFAGNLSKNGVTSSLMNLLKYVDKTAHNYFINFKSGRVHDDKDILQSLSEDIQYITTIGPTNYTIKQLIYQCLFYGKMISFEKYWRVVESAFPNEIARRYGNIKFSNVIQFTGYGTKELLLYSKFDSNCIIYVHSDMINEIKTRKRPDKAVLEYAYSCYDRIAVVTEGIISKTKMLLKKERRLDLAHNIIDHQELREKSTCELKFDFYTQSNVALADLKSVLYDKSKKVFVNVGRYSPEKGHFRLIEAFCRVYKDNPNVYLVIIGGNQLKDDYEKLSKHVESLECRGHIFLILQMSNPFPLIKLCDYFVLSSFYEGFGLVLAEANVLGLPIVSTDIDGPRNFMQQNRGRIVENSMEGIFEGMVDLLEGRVPVIDIDYEAYNKKALTEFYSLLEK